MHDFVNGDKPIASSSKADIRTQRRWWNEFGSKMQQWVGLLESRAYEVLDQVPSLFRQSNPLKRLEETLSHLPALPSWWSVLIKTLWWLKTSHPFCLARPP
ncbi:MAG: hypothetical protein IBX61_09695 [Thermoleophilia bacterium]|nr:hypothetical protein [Thermoleophilia bacterium]